MYGKAESRWKVFHMWDRTNQSRIDYWQISQALDNVIDEVTINKVTYSDHSIVRDRGIWKLNATLLNNDIFRSVFIDN